MTNIPPSLPITQDTWFTRNRKWFIPLVCLAGMGIVLAFATLIIGSVFGIMKRSDAYSGAIARVKEAPAVREALGTPIHESWFLSGNINVNGSGGKADLAIPISGPKGKATIYVDATKELGIWHFNGLVVAIQSTQQRIDLSESRLNPSRF